MIFKIDIENKSVTVEGNLSLNKFFDNLEKLIPRNEWEDWRIDAYSFYYYLSDSPTINPYIPDYPIVSYDTTEIKPLNNAPTTSLTFIEIKDE